VKVFWKLLEKSVIIRGALALVVTIAWVILLCDHQSTPPELWILLGMAWGYFYGSGAIKDAQTVVGKERNRRATDPR
jgi:hypothetical protein